jgi:hypothetical protein
MLTKSNFGGEWPDKRSPPGHRIKIDTEGPCTYVGSFEVSVLAHVALRMLAAIFPASAMIRCTGWLLHLLASKLHIFALKNEDALHRRVALLLLIFVLWQG